MKKLILIMCIFLLCACSNNENTKIEKEKKSEEKVLIEPKLDQEDVKKDEEEKLKEDALKSDALNEDVIKPSIEEPKEIIKEENVINEVVIPETNKETNKDTNKDIKQSTPTPEIKEDIKYIDCYMKQVSETKGWIARIDIKGTFKDNELIYFTMSVTKKYNEGYNAENDEIYNELTNEKINSMNGRTGSIKIENNTVYYVLNYDLNIIEDKSIVTNHTEYNDYLDKRISDGWTCNVS